MSDKHIIKLTEKSAVVKMYNKTGVGGTIDIILATDLKLPSETFDANKAKVHIDKIYWTNKTNKEILLTRFGQDLIQHGDYYLSGNGDMEFIGFRDSSYSNNDFRASFTGEGTLILVLSKESGYSIV